MHRTTRHSVSLLVAAVVASALAGCSSESNSTGTPSGTGFPVTLHAANGTVHIPAKPKAIVSLSPTATEMLYAIGAGHQVKAVDQDSNYPPGAPVTELSGFTPNVESIIAEEPDLVVVAGDSADLTGHLGAAGIPVLSLPAANTLSDVWSQLRELGAATGDASAASQETASLQSKIHTLVVKTHAPAHATYYYELDPTYYSATSSTFIGQLLGMLGLHDMVTGDANGGYPQLSSEAIIKADPTFIFLADTKCCGATPGTVAGRPGWDSIAAVRSRNVVNLDDDIASRWGPRIVDLLQVVSDAVDRAAPATSSAPAG